MGGAQRLDRTTETVQRPHGAKDVSGTGPLASVLSQESLFAAKGEQFAEQQGLGFPLHEPAAELAQHGWVKAGLDKERPRIVISSVIGGSPFGSMSHPTPATPGWLRPILPRSIDDHRAAAPSYTTGREYVMPS